MHILLLLAWAASVQAAKYPGGNGVHPGGHAPKKPKGITADLYCLACKAIVKESVKLLYGKTKQSDVIVMLEDMCDMWRYDTYDFHPPMMQKGCTAIQNYYEEELEWALVHRNELDADLETHFCQHMIEACAPPGSEPVSEDSSESPPTSESPPPSQAPTEASPAASSEAGKDPARDSTL